ncbi:NPCBM/NEW2 domain-containing protein [Paludisphaera rhizosphaerae]|uniref:NPCBM/NEW2 domain-containing protein n=1 Tax=Paludisphaera rhizosphaerae TaxID=2711216 RepID=UPI0013EDAC15|nr:NPCBM/NEW2 domain-containing protein [Paludisphaera rhizosphaerae]
MLTTTGPGSSGTIVALSPDGITVAPAEGPAKEFAATDLIRLRRESEVVVGEGSYVVLPGGDRLARARVGSATDTAVEVEAEAIGKANVPLDALLGLILTPPSDPDAFDALLRKIRTEPRTSEVAWLANGDRVVGSFLGMDDRVVKLQSQDAAAPRELAREGVVAVGFDPALIAYPKPEGPYLEMGLIDGSRLGVVGAKLERGRVSGVSRFAAKVDVPIDSVIQATPRTEAVQYLSERPVDGKIYVPFFDIVRPFQVDASVEGRPLLLNGLTYDRGFGASSRTLLAFKLKPGDRRFQALVGVDGRAGPSGSVVFRVLTDGKARFTSDPLTYRDAPIAVDVDLEGAKLLILATEFGERGDARDLADWVEARIVRNP